jgi:tetratricopeptide (TPR) repeat protein
VYAEIAYSAMLDPAAIDHGDRALSIFREIGHDRYLDSALTNTALTMMYLGRWDLAMQRYHQAAAHARLTGHILHLGNIHGNLGFLLYRMGRLEEAEVAGRRAVRLLDASNVPLLAGYPRILLALLAATDDRFEEAHRFVGEARAAFTAANDTPMELDCDVTTMALLLREGRHAEVVERGRPLTARLIARVDQVEPEVMVTLGRVLGCAEMAAGERGAGEGLERVTDALLAARRDSLLYEVYRCVEVLARLGGDASAAVERDELAASLGMEAGPERRP